MKEYKLDRYKYLSLIFIGIIYVTVLNHMLAILALEKLQKIFGENITVRLIIFNSIIYLIIYFISLWQWEGMAVGRRRILDMIFAHFITSVGINTIVLLTCWIFYLLNILQAILLITMMVVIQTVVGCGWILWMQRIYEKVQFKKDTLFVYGSKDNPYEYIGMQSVIKQYFAVSENISCFEETEVLKNKILKSQVIYLGDVPTQLRNELLKFCMKSKIEAYSFTKISDIYIHSSEMRQLHDKILFKYPFIGIKSWQKITKRVLDIIISILLLVGLSPVLALIAICVKLGDGGPIFFNQARVTCDNHPFLMHKFRSMRVDAEKEGARMASKNDSRVTCIGKVIRNLHMDELPQLINVIKGEMSLVGPRPERREFIEEYSKQIPEFSERLKVQGGLTGYAQVYGKYNTTPEDKIKYDLYYIYNYSLWLDFKIIVLTIRILFQKENTEGIEEGQGNALERKQAPSS